MAATLSLDLIVDDKGTATIRKFTRGVGQQFGKVETLLTKRLGGGLRRFAELSGGAIKGVARQVFSLKGAIAGLGLGYLAKEALSVAAGFERMQLSLDTITQGQGEEWFKRLNEWALKMPVNTEKAIESFTLLRAMGLQPTIEQMTTLVDTTSALGGSADMMEGIARALGQIATKGKVSAEELMQLAERGLPAYEILREKLGLTAEQVANIGTAGVEAQTAIAALFEGMAERFGGQSKKMQETASGLWESIKSYWKDFVRMVMESGVLDWIKDKTKLIVDNLDALAETGRLKEWAQVVGETVVGALEKLVDWVKSAADGALWLERKWWDFKVAAAEAIHAVGQGFKGLADRIKKPLEPVFEWLQRKLDGLQNWLNKIRSGGGVLGAVAGAANKAVSFARAVGEDPTGGTGEALAEVQAGRERVARRQEGLRTAAGAILGGKTVSGPPTFSNYGPGGLATGRSAGRTRNSFGNVNINLQGTSTTASAEEVARQTSRELEKLAERGAM